MALKCCAKVNGFSQKMQKSEENGRYWQNPFRGILPIAGQEPEIFMVPVLPLFLPGRFPGVG